MTAIHKYLSCLMLLCTAAALKAQKVSPQVINVAGGGGAAGSTGVEVYYNIGEAFYSTVSNGGWAITQGFLQPDIVGRFGLRAGAYVTPASCADRADGVIRVDAGLSGAPNRSNFSISYYWSAGVPCAAANSCSVATNLAAGTYSVLVVSSYDGPDGTVPNDTVRLTDIVVSGSAEPCQITVYNGFTPNGDGVNDVFYIENIAQFPSNKVEIFNRWGQKLADIGNYNNEDRAWHGTMGGSGQTAPSGTYFYIIDLGNGTVPLKGWIELTASR